MVWLYWQIGHRLRTEFLKDGRAEYGKRIIHTVAISLTQEFGRGFGQQLSWTHLRELLSIEDPLKRRFYTELCCLERWSTRTRTAIAQRPTSVIDEALATLESGQLATPDLVFRDPYILDLLGMPADYSESELETAILRELEQFLLELGAGFTFVTRQKRMPTPAIRDRWSSTCAGWTSTSVSPGRIRLWV